MLTEQRKHSQSMLQSDSKGDGGHTTLSALLIEDKDYQVKYLRSVFRQVGIKIIHSPSVREGLQLAKQLLHPAMPQIDLVILDWLLPDPLSPSLDATAVAAHLVAAMDAGELQPCHVIVLTQMPFDACAEPAFRAGCSLVLQKPLTRDSAIMLRNLAHHAPVYPLPADRKQYQEILRLTRPIVELLTQIHPPTIFWDEKKVRRLLKATGSQRS